MTDYITNKMETSLKITKTKTTGEDEIKRAKERGEDVAILSTVFDLNNSKKPERFNCALAYNCLEGDHTKIAQGSKNKTWEVLMNCTCKLF